MVAATKSASSGAPAKKAKTGKKGGKKLTEFNKFMQTELAKLKEDKPDVTHKERFKMVIENWNKKKGKS